MLMFCHVAISQFFTQNFAKFILETVLIFQVIAAGMNPVQIARGIEKTSKALVSELKMMSKEVHQLI